MSKLPATYYKRLKAAIESGEATDPDSEGYDFITGDLWYALQKFGDPDSKRPASDPLRQVGTLVECWSALLNDGALVGIACNQPQIVPIAIDAAKEFGLPNFERTLRAIQKCIPQKVLDMDDGDEDRLEWYESKEGAKLAEKLEAIEEKWTDGPEEDIIAACAPRMLADRESYFK